MHAKVLLRSTRLRPPTRLAWTPAWPAAAAHYVHCAVESGQHTARPAAEAVRHEMVSRLARRWSGGVGGGKPAVTVCATQVLHASAAQPTSRSGAAAASQVRRGRSGLLLQGCRQLASVFGQT